MCADLGCRDMSCTESIIHLTLYRQFRLKRSSGHHLGPCNNKVTPKHHLCAISTRHGTVPGSLAQPDAIHPADPHTDSLVPPEADKPDGQSEHVGPRMAT